MCLSTDRVYINKNHLDYMAQYQKLPIIKSDFWQLNLSPSCLITLLLSFLLFIFSCISTQSPIYTHFHRLSTSFTLPTSTLNFNYSSTSTGEFPVLHLFSLPFSLSFSPPFLFFLVTASMAPRYSRSKGKGEKKKREEKGNKFLSSMLIVFSGVSIGIRGHLSLTSIMIIPNVEIMKLRVQTSWIYHDNVR